MHSMSYATLVTLYNVQQRAVQIAFKLEQHGINTAPNVEQRKMLLTHKENEGKTLKEKSICGNMRKKRNKVIF